MNITVIVLLALWFALQFPVGIALGKFLKYRVA